MKMNAFTTNTLVTTLATIACTSAFNPNFTLLAKSAVVDTSTLGDINTYDISLSATVNKKAIIISFENTEQDDDIESYTSFYRAEEKDDFFGEKLSFASSASAQTVIDLATNAGGEQETLLNNSDIALAVEQAAILRNALINLAT